ncbi:glycosyltransferase family 90 protein [Nemania sp. FL0916]|nr:glycosyltransferase family 90 protein [Nemania sp. FL0916]
MRPYTSSSSGVSRAWLPKHSDQRQGFAPKTTASAWDLVIPHIWSAGAALVLSVLTCYWSPRQSELTSEILCWLLLPFIFSKARRDRNVRGPGITPPLNGGLKTESRRNGPPSPVSLWLVALCIAICSVFRAQRGIIVLFPVLVPLLVISHRYQRLDLYPSKDHRASPLSLLTQSIAGTTVAAGFAIAALSEWDLLAFSLSLAPVAALFIAYNLLTPESDNRLRWLRSFDLKAESRSLSLRIEILLVIALVVESCVIGFPSINAIETLALGLFKALLWYHTSRLARNSSWVDAAVAGTFGLLATRNPFAQHAESRACMTVLASLISLGQMISLQPKQGKVVWALGILFFIPLLPYLANLAAIQNSQSLALEHADKHPVEVLIRDAKANFNNLLQTQSRTYEAAYTEYQRRYGFEPPPGFEDWYKFAQSHHSPIIDEFDIISEGIAPFLQLSGKEVLDIMKQVYDGPDHELWSCTISGQPAKTQCSHHRRTNDRNNVHFFDSIISKIPAQLDVKFLLNHLDEPTVLIPPPDQRTHKPNITDFRGKRSWDTLVKYCSSRKSSTPTTQRKPPIKTYGLPFVTDSKASMDLCSHAQYSSMHGLLAAPESLRLIDGLVPVLSSGALSTMGDILYPSAAYLEDERFRYDESHDREWEQKQNKLYWAGSTTGGHATEDKDWQDLHRQRFVALAQNLRDKGEKRREFSYLREDQNNKGIINRVTSSFLNSRLYSVFPTKILQCSPATCRSQSQYFRTRSWAPASLAYASRLVFDVDGNGISGRWYSFLSSRSTPLKQTLLREWHDDRLVPWVHYVPVSLDMGELPELVFFLTSTETGRERAREIAEAGRDWFGKAFREVDVVIYVYRLLLELQRLQDPDRRAWEGGDLE